MLAASQELPLYFSNHTIDASAMDYPYTDILGASFLFYEAQRSGNLSATLGGNRILWRGNQLLDDGSDVGRDLSGGYYEAGSVLSLAWVRACCVAR
jgi:hypothetical protein